MPSRWTKAEAKPPPPPPHPSAGAQSPRPNPTKTPTAAERGRIVPSSSSRDLQLAKPMTPVKVAPPPVLVEDAGGDNGGRSNGASGSLSPRKSFDVAPGAAISAARGGDSGNDNRRVDFIGPSKAVKNLFSLPYNNDRNVSVALHNMGNGTILMDSGEDIVGHVEGRGTTANKNMRRGRRRQRPRSWSIRGEEEGFLKPNTSGEDDGSEHNQHLQLAQLREGERSLLASLSLLLEEEKRQRQSEGANIVSYDKGEEGDIIQLSSSSQSEKEVHEEATNNSNENNSLLVPSSAIVVSRGGRNDVNESEPIISATTTATPHANCNSNVDTVDMNDPLAAMLCPPEHYVSHVVSAPTEPRQYVDWMFRDTKLLVASDALIFNRNDVEGALGQLQWDNNFDDDDDHRLGCGLSDAGESIAIRFANASELRAQMKYHESMVMKGIYDVQGDRDGRKPHALPPSSYAEVLKLPPPLREGDLNTGGQEEAPGLQTCIIPASSGIGPEWAQLGFSPSQSPPPAIIAEDATFGHVAIDSNSLSEAVGSATAETPKNSTSSNPLPQYSSSPVCTVLDAYLDNIMANVPQLALILREHGFVQNIKLLRNEDIPSLMMHPSTIGAGNGEPGSPPAAVPIFSPEIVEMNAAMLLRFLKANCSCENSTYLLHRAAGDTNIQLFDISSISEHRQRKWVWWLALCSYRFACRLEQLQANVLSPRDKVTRREYRSRQRGLLHNTLDLLEELADMDGGRHDTIGAAVCEHLANTYLWNDEADGDVGSRDPSRPAPCASSSQPYPKVTVDCLNKANDHLMNSIKKLNPLLLKARKGKLPIEIEAISTQLYGIHHKIVNVNLRLADHHLQNYFSSNLIQSLRTAARMLSDAALLLASLDMFEFGGRSVDNADSNLYARSILLQYAWLWEYCGHFARSFAADGLWRDRGHTCGADLIGLFGEINASCSVITERCFGWARDARKKSRTTSVGAASHGQVSLNSLSGIVILPTDFEQIEASVLQKEGCHEAIGAAKSILNEKTQIKRDARLVLVAACVCYGRAIDSCLFLSDQSEEEGDDTNDGPETPSVSSKSEKDSMGDLNLISTTLDGVAVAPLLRQRLGDACNEIGKILLEESRAVLLPQFSPRDKGSIASERFGMSHVSAILLASAQFWFFEGLEQFTEGKDLRNLALLRCNLCQCCKIRANTNVILPGTSLEDSRKNNSEAHLQKAVDHLVSAHEAMGQKEVDPVTWDMVSEELAATLLVLGVRRRQSALSSSSEPLMFQALRLTPGMEKAIVEPMERSCQIYESLGTVHASHQAAAAHYHLALYFSKVWTCQRDEVKTREKLAAAFKHYGSAHQYFFQHISGNETTFVVLSLDFSSLYSAVVTGEESLRKALLCCLDTREAFSPPVAPVTMEQMATLEESVEARVGAIVLNLVKIEKEGNSKLRAGQKPSDKYKTMYRKVLAHKMKSYGNGESNNRDEEGSEDPAPTFPIFELLNTLYKELM